jgi:syntaxin-binding protein 1
MCRVLQPKRLIVFVVGGITHSEVRIAHKLSSRLGRDIILGSTAVDNPTVYLKHIHDLSSLEQIALEIDGSDTKYKS